MRLGCQTVPTDPGYGKGQIAEVEPNFRSNKGNNSRQGVNNTIVNAVWASKRVYDKET